MNKVDTHIFHEDERGKIIDLLENEDINAATLVTFRKNSIRGNHFHKRTFQWNYVISGKIKIVTQQPNEGVREMTICKGDFVLTVPNEQHMLIALEDSELMVFTKGPRSGRQYETDTFRMKAQPEIVE